jgi:type III secretion system YscQ/HrcQ family protein
MSADQARTAETPAPQEGHGRGIDPESGRRDPLDPWAGLPRVSRRHVRLGRRIVRWACEHALRDWLDWVEPRIGTRVEFGPPEIIARASGVGRPGLIAQFRWPAMSTRLAIGLEVPLAHTIVDRLLGYDRPLSETRLQLTPVEWGVWTYLIARILDAHLPREDEEDGPDRGTSRWPLGAWDLLLDRVGPDPFDPTGLGPVATLRWPVRVGPTAGTARVWLAESLLDLVPEWEYDPARTGRPAVPPSSAQWSAVWRAEAGSVPMPRGLGRLRVGGVLPISDSRLSGTPQDPSGPIVLSCEPSDTDRRFLLPAEPVADSGGRLVRLTGMMTDRPRAGEDPFSGNPTTMNPDQPPSAEPTATPESSPLDVPVTLIVELGKVNLTLNRLADLRPGDVIELGRHSREPVELTSGGRLVARGELILIDTELGVRVTHVFL